MNAFWDSYEQNEELEDAADFIAFAEPELIARRPLMLNQAREVLCQGRFRTSLI